MSVNYSSVKVGSSAGLRVSACVPICEVGNYSKTNSGLFVQGAGTSPAFFTPVCTALPYEMIAYSGNTVPMFASTTAGSTMSSSAPIVSGLAKRAPGTPGPLAANWISPHVPLIALAFDRYRVAGLTFHYEPQATSTVADRLVFAWTDDPQHPFLSTAGAMFQGSGPSQLQQLVTQDSVAFMPWKQWSLTVPVSPDPRFMYSEGAETSDAENTTQDRFFSFGSLSCVNSATGGDSTLYGILYASIVIDLFDPVPIVSSVASLVEELHRVRKNARNKRKSIEKKEDLSVCTLAHFPSLLRSSDPDDEDVVSVTPVKHSAAATPASAASRASPALPLPLTAVSLSRR